MIIEKISELKQQFFVFLLVLCFYFESFFVLCYVIFLSFYEKAQKHMFFRFLLSVTFSSFFGLVFSFSLVFTPFVSLKNRKTLNQTPGKKVDSMTRKYVSKLSKIGVTS